MRCVAALLSISCATTHALSEAPAQSAAVLFLAPFDADVASALTAELSSRGVALRAALGVAKEYERDFWRHLPEATPPEAWALLLEVDASPFAQLEGKFRWTIDARLHVWRPDLAAPVVSTQSWPTVLSFAHEGQREAIQSVLPWLREWVATALVRSP